MSIRLGDLAGCCSTFWFTYLHKCPAVVPVSVMTRLNISRSVYGVWNALLETIHFSSQEEAGFNLNPTHFTGCSKKKKKKAGLKYDVKARCCVQTNPGSDGVGYRRLQKESSPTTSVIAEVKHNQNDFKQNVHQAVIKS